VEVEFDVELIEPPVTRRPVEELRFVRERPPVKVEVADEVMFRVPEEVMFPPVTVTPFDEDTPAVATPPEKVEVAVVEVALMYPNCPTPPSIAEA